MKTTRSKDEQWLATFKRQGDLGVCFPHMAHICDEQRNDLLAVLRLEGQGKIVRSDDNWWGCKFTLAEAMTP